MENKVNILNKFFTRNIINSFIENQSENISTLITKKYFFDEIFSTNIDFISKLYNYMFKNYRNEYIYVNTLLNKLLIGKHSLKTTTAISQLPIEKSKADFILINGKAVVYEIKTALDTFERLLPQLDDYYKGFPYVYVVTSNEQYSKLKNLLENTPTGIFVLSDKNTLQEKKEAKENFRNISHHTLFKILRKKEYENIIKKYYELPQCKQVFYYNECLEIFKKIPLDKVYKDFMNELKKRNKVVNADKFKKMPDYIKSIVYFSNLKDEQYDKIFNYLYSDYKEGNKCTTHI